MFFNELFSLKNVCYLMDVSNFFYFLSSHVFFLSGYKVGQVSCGLNHTACVSQDGLDVWTFGEGDYGKLGKYTNRIYYYLVLLDFFMKLQISLPFL